MRSMVRWGLITAFFLLIPALASADGKGDRCGGHIIAKYKETIAGSKGCVYSNYVKGHVCCTDDGKLQETQARLQDSSIGKACQEQGAGYSISGYHDGQATGQQGLFGDGCCFEVDNQIFQGHKWACYADQGKGAEKVCHAPGSEPIQPEWLPIPDGVTQAPSNAEYAIDANQDYQGDEKTAATEGSTGKTPEQTSPSGATPSGAPAQATEFHPAPPTAPLTIYTANGVIRAGGAAKSASPQTESKPQAQAAGAKTIVVADKASKKVSKEPRAATAKVSIKRAPAKAVRASKSSGMKNVPPEFAKALQYDNAQYFCEYRGRIGSSGARFCCVAQGGNYQYSLPQCNFDSYSTDLGDFSQNMNDEWCDIKGKQGYTIRCIHK